MTLTAAALKIMADKGLSAHDVAEIAAANEKRADPTAAQRQARCRARRAESQRDVTRDPPNDNSSNPQVHSPKPDGLAPQSKPKRDRGTRLPNDWSLPVEWAAWARERRGWSDGEIAEEAEIFANYWQAKSGAGACHTDWFKTWRNWVIRSHRADGQAGRTGVTAEQVRANRLALADLYDKQGRANEAEEMRRLAA